MLETPSRIEPCFFEEHIPAELADLSVDIQREATRLGQGLRNELLLLEPYRGPQHPPS